MKKILPVHPGEILEEEFLKPLAISQNRLGRDIAVSPRRINENIPGKRAITADTALRLSRYFGNSAGFWLDLKTPHNADTGPGDVEQLLPEYEKLLEQIAETRGRLKAQLMEALTR